MMYGEDFPSIDPNLWSNRYLLGFAQGTLMILTHFFGSGLTTEQRGMVTVDTFKGLVGPQYAVVCGAISELHECADPDFKLGVVEGANVAILMSNRPSAELLANPDVQAALRDAPLLGKLSTQVLGSSSMQGTSSAGAALMHIYIQRQVESNS